jgi:hypothetical protein
MSTVAALLTPKLPSDVPLHCRCRHVRGVAIPLRQDSCEQPEQACRSMKTPARGRVDVNNGRLCDYARDACGERRDIAAQLLNRPLGRSRSGNASARDLLFIKRGSWLTRPCSEYTDRIPVSRSRKKIAVGIPVGDRERAPTLKDLALSVSNAHPSLA